MDGGADTLSAASLIAAALGPLSAFCVFIAGLFGVYCELVFPGRIFPGVLGAFAALAGAYCIWRDSASVWGILLASAGLLLFLSMAIWNLHLFGGSASTIGGFAAAFCFIAGSVSLFPQSPRFIWVAAPCSLLFSAVTLLLAKFAHRARDNKRLKAD